MGINIYIETDDHEKHPDWDSDRYAGDRQFPEWTDECPRVYCDKNDIDNFHFRPVDFPAWRAAQPSDRDNPDRFPAMLDILEEDERYWIYFSY